MSIDQSIHTEDLAETQREAVAALRQCGVNVEYARPTGSAYYGKDSPADFDVLVLLSDKDDLTGDKLFGKVDLESLAEKLAELGWADCADTEGNTSGGDTDDESYYGIWIAARKGNRNMIVTDDEVYYYRHAAASELVASICRKQNRVLPKGRVIQLFRMVRDGVTE